MFQKEQFLLLSLASLCSAALVCFWHNSAEATQNCTDRERREGGRDLEIVGSRRWVLKKGSSGKGTELIWYTHRTFKYLYVYVSLFLNPPPSFWPSCGRMEMRNKTIARAVKPTRVSGIIGIVQDVLRSPFKDLNDNVEALEKKNSTDGCDKDSLEYGTMQGTGTTRIPFPVFTFFLFFDPFQSLSTDNPEARLQIHLPRVPP